MSETMYDCYLSQFKTMQKILTESASASFTDFYKSAAPDRIYLFGSGTSYNACSAAAPFMEEALGVEVTVTAPTQAGKLYGKPLVIAVSQGGRSTNTLAAIKNAKENGASVVTLTDPKDTPVGAVADLALHLQADDEQIGAKTRGYTATVLTLYLMALETAFALGSVNRDFYNRKLNALKDTIAKGEEYFAACQDFYNANFENLKTMKNIIFTGKGIPAKVAQEDALKVLETLCYPSLGYEYEEFLHGPACCTSEELGLFIFLTSGADRERMIKTSEMISGATANCYIISHDPDIRGDKVLYLPSEDPDFCSPFIDILFGQLLSAKLTEDLGRERHPAVKDIFTSMGTKVKN